MKVRKAKDIQKVLLKKGFVLDPDKKEHQFYFLDLNGKKSGIYTFFSHSKKEYDKTLMNQIKTQLKFTDSAQAEKFFDCPMSGEQYVAMLKENGNI